MGQWHFQLSFCNIYYHTCRKLPHHWIFSPIPDFRGLSPPEECTAALFSGNHWVCFCSSLLHINSGLSLRVLFYVCSPINHKSWDSPLFKTASIGPSFCNFSVRENVSFYLNSSPIFNWFVHFQFGVISNSTDMTNPKSPKTFEVFGFKCVLKIYRSWGFQRKQKYFCGALKFNQI